MENFKSIYCRAKSIMNKEEDVQALMQEVYALADESKISDDKAEAWMIKKTYLLGCGKFRKKKAREAEIIELQEDEYEAQKGIDRDKTKEIICETLAELPDLYHATLFAFYYDQYSVKEVAAVTGYSEGVVINRLNYIHKYLSRKLEDYQEEYKVKVQFSVEMVFEALKQWAAENTLETDEQGVLCTSDVEAVKTELQEYSVKTGLDKKQVFIIAVIVGGLAILALIALLVMGSKDKKSEQKDNQTKVENQVEDQVEGDEEQIVVDENEGEDVSQGETVQDEQVSDSEYILPTSNTEKLTRDDLQGLSKEELRLARNEIYARYGVIFGAADLNAYFGEKSWYEPTITLDEFNESGDLNSYEAANLSLIVDVEDEME